MKGNDILFLVGRWDLLPEEWEGINGLYEKSDDEIKQEVARQMDLRTCDWNIGCYTKIEFQETFNGDNEREFTGVDYFIHIIA